MRSSLVTRLGSTSFGADLQAEEYVDTEGLDLRGYMEQAEAIGEVVEDGDGPGCGIYANPGGTLISWETADGAQWFELFYPGAGSLYCDSCGARMEEPDDPHPLPLILDLCPDCRDDG